MAIRYLTPFLIIAAAFVIDMTTRPGDALVATVPHVTVAG
jgi:hypothetical protein